MHASGLANIARNYFLFLSFFYSFSSSFCAPVRAPAAASCLDVVLRRPRRPYVLRPAKCISVRF